MTRRFSKKTINQSQNRIKNYKGRVAFCFLVIKNLKNIELWKKYFKGYEDYISIYSHISGPDYEKGLAIFDNLLWSNRVDEHGVPHIKTSWGTTSLVEAEGLLYKTALKNKENKFFCLLSESDIPVLSFPDFYNSLKNKSYFWYRMNRAIDADMFLDCFPKKYIPSKDISDYRKWSLVTIPQWKVLYIKEVKEFMKMINNKEYTNSYENCFIKNPERLAPDEYMFACWLSLKYGTDYFRKNIINKQTTWVNFKGKSIHPIEYSSINNRMKNMICQEPAFFARKFIHNDELHTIKC